MRIPEKRIDLATWDRKEHFDFFSNGYGLPLYDITTQVDVTHFYQYIKYHDISFYYGLIYATTKTMNQIENFRYKIRNDEVILLDYLVPSFTDLKKQSELFHIVTLELEGSMKNFLMKLKE